MEEAWSYLFELLVLPTVVGIGTLVIWVVVPVEVTGLVIVLDPLVMVSCETVVNNTVVNTSLNDVTPSLSSNPALAPANTPFLFGVQ